MIKQVSLMKRHPDLTVDTFVDRYENHQAKFGKVLFANAERFVRRYVQLERNLLTGKTREPDFDVIMEIWSRSRKDMEAAMTAISSSGLADDIRASSASLFGLHDNPAVTVTEHDSPLRRRRDPD